MFSLCKASLRKKSRPLCVRIFHPRKKRACRSIPPNTATPTICICARAIFFVGVERAIPRESAEKALRLLDQAIARDPQFALAHSLASRFHNELYWFGFDKTHARLTKAKAAVDTALRLHPELGDAHLAMAYYYYYGFRDYERARAELVIALRATPNDAEVWDGMA